MNHKNELHVVLGTGPIGMAIMEALLTRGKTVRMVNRSGGADVPAGVEVRGGDLSNPEEAIALCDGASVVYSTVNPPYDKWPELFPTLQAAVVEGAAAAGAKLVVLENVYMYGPNGGSPMVEDTPYAATTRKGRTRAEMSRALMEAHERGKVRVVIARASDYFGPRGLMSSMGDRVFYPALEGKPAQVLGNPDFAHTYTYLPDIGEGMVILGESDEALGQVWHLPSAGTLTTRQFIEMVYEEAGHPTHIQIVPKGILRAIGLFNAEVREVVEMLYQFEGPHILDHSKFERAFGNGSTPLREAIRETTRWYRQNPRMK
jgi:nucleoside-diphosphate-sugar epimerase